MMITPDVNLKCCVAGCAVQRNGFKGKFGCHLENKLNKRLLDLFDRSLYQPQLNRRL
jgi:hypothetical protein